MLVLTTFDLDEYVYDALRAGASGFLLKDTLPDDLLAAIRVVAARRRAAVAPDHPPPHRGVRPPPRAVGRRPRRRCDGLTERELEVLALVAKGLSNAEIAAELIMSPATAKTHVSRLLTKLGARDRTQLVMIAYETGVTTPGAG